jgi:hypothetical protein
MDKTHNQCRPNCKAPSLKEVVRIVVSLLLLDAQVWEKWNIRDNFLLFSKLICKGKTTPRRGRVLYTSASYSEGSRFISQPGDGLSWLRLFAVFLSWSYSITTVKEEKEVDHQYDINRLLIRLIGRSKQAKRPKPCSWWCIIVKYSVTKRHEQ